MTSTIISFFKSPSTTLSELEIENIKEILKNHFNYEEEEKEEILFKEVIDLYHNTLSYSGENEREEEDLITKIENLDSLEREYIILYVIYYRNNVILEYLLSKFSSWQDIFDKNSIITNYIIKAIGIDKFENGPKTLLDFAILIDKIFNTNNKMQTVLEKDFLRQLEIIPTIESASFSERIIVKRRREKKTGRIPTGKFNT